MLSESTLGIVSKKIKLIKFCAYSTPEVFPAPNRGTGTGIASFFNRVAGLCAPIVAVNAGSANPVGHHLIELYLRRFGRLTKRLECTRLRIWLSDLGSFRRHVLVPHRDEGEAKSLRYLFVASGYHRS